MERYIIYLYICMVKHKYTHKILRNKKDLFIYRLIFLWVYRYIGVFEHKNISFYI